MMRKIIRCDIDNTICRTPCVAGVNLYEESTPWKDEIKVINALYKAGHYIVYWTSRGASTGCDYRELTEKQLKEWGCLYHDLQMNKPSFDLIIDDKAISSLKDWEAVQLGLLDIG